MAETSRVSGAWSVPAPEYVIERRVDALSVLGGRMGHATPGGAGPAAAAPSTGRAAPAGGPAVVRRRAAGAGVGEFGVAVVADVSARRAAGPAAQADPGSTAAVVRGPAAPAGEDPGAGSAPGWLPHGSLDPRAGGHGDPSGVRDSVSPQPCPVEGLCNLLVEVVP